VTPLNTNIRLLSRILTYYVIPLRNPKVVSKTPKMLVSRDFYIHEDYKPNNRF